MALPEIRMTSLNSPIYGYVYKDAQFDLNAPYQRASVWTVDQRRALIKSILMGLPVGSVICAKLPFTEDTHYRVVDGKQRIEAVVAFTKGEFSVPMDWWNPRCVRDDLPSPDIEGRTVVWSDLTEQGQRQFTNHALPMLEFDPFTEWHEDPEHPEAKARNNRWYTTKRTPAEALAYEAMVYGLINGGGTDQTDEDMARAAAIAGGES
jgi:hypothetical protein